MSINVDNPSLADLLNIWLEKEFADYKFFYVERVAESIKCGWCQQMLSYIYDDHVWPCALSHSDLQRLYAVDPEFLNKLEVSLSMHKCRKCI